MPTATTEYTDYRAPSTEHRVPTNEYIQSTDCRLPNILHMCPGISWIFSTSQNNSKTYKTSTNALEFDLLSKAIQRDRCAQEHRMTLHVQYHHYSSSLQFLLSRGRCSNSYMVFALIGLVTLREYARRHIVVVQTPEHHQFHQSDNGTKHDAIMAHCQISFGQVGWIQVSRILSQIAKFSNKPVKKGAPALQRISNHIPGYCTLHSRPSKEFPTTSPAIAPCTV